MLITTFISTILLTDSLPELTQDLDEVVIVSTAARGGKRSVKGQTATIDEHLKVLLRL